MAAEVPHRTLLFTEEDAQLVGEILADNNITDETIRNNLIIDFVLAAFLFFSFCFLQRSSILYRFRLVSPSVTYKPPELPKKGWAGMFGWVLASVAISDKELLTSCGLDALMMVKASELGVQLFLPLTVVGLSVLLPIHLHGGAILNLKSQTSNYLRFTVSNLGNNSSLLWIHVALLHCYIAYACWLLKWHYQQFMQIRQFFLQKGEDVNMWRMLYQGDKPPTSQIAELFGLVPMLKNFGLNRLSNAHIPDHDIPVGGTGHTTITLEGVPAQAKTQDALPAGALKPSLSRNSASPLLKDDIAPSHPGAYSPATAAPTGRLHPLGSSSPLLPRFKHTDSSTGALPATAAPIPGSGAGGATGPSPITNPLDFIASILGHEHHQQQQQQSQPQQGVLRRRMLSNRQTLSSTGAEQGPGEGSDTALDVQPRVQSLVAEQHVSSGRRDLTTMYTLDERRRRMAALTQLINAEQSSYERSDTRPISPLRTSPFLGGHASVPLPNTNKQTGSTATAHAQQYLQASLRDHTAVRIEPVGVSKPSGSGSGGGGPSTAGPSTTPSINLLQFDSPIRDRSVTALDLANVNMERTRSSAPELPTPKLQAAVPLSVKARAEALRQGTFAPSFSEMLKGMASGAAEQLAPPGADHNRQTSAGQQLHLADLAAQQLTPGQAPLLPLPLLSSLRPSVDHPTRPPLPALSGGPRVSPRSPQALLLPTTHDNPTPTITEIEPTSIPITTTAASTSAGAAAPAHTAVAAATQARSGLVQSLPAGSQIGRSQDDLIRQRPSRPHHRRVPSEGTEIFDQAVTKSRLGLQTSPSQASFASKGGAPSLVRPASGYFQTMYTDGGALPSNRPSPSPDVSPDSKKDASGEGPSRQSDPRRNLPAGEELFDEVPRWWGKVVLKADLARTGSTGSHAPSQLASAKGSLEPTALGRMSFLGSTTSQPRSAGGRHSRSASTGAPALPVSAFALTADSDSQHVSISNTSPANSDAPMLSAPQRCTMTRKHTAGLPVAWTVPAPLEIPSRGGEEEDSALQQLDLLAMPSVRARKTINTKNFRDDIIAVNAEHYVVLVTDVPQPLYNRECSWMQRRSHTSLSSAASASHNGPDSPFLFLSVAAGAPDNEPRHVDQVNIELQAGPGLRAPGSGSLQPNGSLHGLGTGGIHAGQMAAVPGRESGGGAGRRVDQEEVMRRRVTYLWDKVRQHVRRRTVQALLYEQRYSMVAATFKQMFAKDFDRAIPVIKHKAVDLLLRKQDLHLAAYEQARLVYDKNGKRLKTRVGPFGLIGKKVDALEYHREQLVTLRRQIKEARATALATLATPSWFVFFKTQMAASIATNTPLHAHDNREFKVRPAPGPEEVNWSALWMTWRQRDLRSALVTPLMIGLILIPIGIFTGGLQQVDALVCPVPRCAYTVTEGDKLVQMTRTMSAQACAAIGGVLSGQQWTWTWYCKRESPVAKLLGWFVVGWGPALLLILWQAACLPLGLYLLTQMSGQCFSLSAVDRYIARWLFYFAVFNVFLGGMLGSAIVHSVTQFVRKGPLEVFVIIGTSLPTSSNFFLNYLLFRAFVGLPCRLVIPHVGVRLFLVRRYLRCVMMLTERDKAVLYAPVSPRYGFEYGMLCIIFLVGCAFSVVSPLLLPLVLFFFMLSFLFWRYSLLYVYVRKYESGGMMFPFLFKRVVQCLYIASLFTACVLMVHQAYIQAIILFVTIPVILYRFSRYCRLRYHIGVRGVPLEYASQAPRAEVDPWVYIPPPLHHKALGWNPDFNKPWQGWDMPVGYATH